MKNIACWARSQAASKRLRDSNVSKSVGQNPKIECELISPEIAKSLKLGENWIVRWEGGPFAWEECLSQGSSIFTHEKRIGWSSKVFENSECEFLIESDEWCLEAHYAFDVSFVLDKLN